MKDSQLDKVEQLAQQVFGLDDIHLDAHLFIKGGLYYEMRRENERLRAFLRVVRYYEKNR